MVYSEETISPFFFCWFILSLDGEKNVKKTKNSKQTSTKYVIHYSKIYDFSLCLLSHVYVVCMSTKLTFLLNY